MKSSAKTSLAPQNKMHKHTPIVIYMCKVCGEIVPDYVAEYIQEHKDASHWSNALGRTCCGTIIPQTTQ